MVVDIRDHPPALAFLLLQVAHFAVASKKFECECGRHLAAYLFGLVISTIIRLRGAGMLLTALAGLLATLSWCRV